MLVIEILLFGSILLVFSDLSRYSNFRENLIYHVFTLCVTKHLKVQMRRDKGKDKEMSTKHYVENFKLGKTNSTKTRGDLE